MAFQGSLGYFPAPDSKHIAMFGLDLLAADARPVDVPVPLGISWYEGFDSPVQGKDGVWRLPTTGLGAVRGGHDICAKNASGVDLPAWWTFFDQGATPACVGFAHARALTLLAKRTFNPFWLYDDARREEGAYPNGEGSTNRSACAALKQWGAHFEDAPAAQPVPWSGHAPGEQITSYHWATNVQQILEALGLKGGGEVTLLQSWGQSYPHEVRADPALIERLMVEGGEASVVKVGA